MSMTMTPGSTFSDIVGFTPEIVAEKYYAICIALDVSGSTLRRVMPIPDKVDIVFVREIRTLDITILRHLIDKAKQCAWTCTLNPRPYLNASLQNVVAYDFTKLVK